MTDRQISEALGEAVREVLEKMFFADLLNPEGEPGPHPCGLSAQLTFEGEPPGSFRLDLDAAAAASAAADFLVEDAAYLAPEQVEEVVCELANMICGSVLSRIESSATFRLAKPEIVRADAIEEPAGSVSSFRTKLGEGALRAEIRVERPVCPDRA